VGGFSSLATDPIVSLLNVPTDEALTWNTVPTDTWAGFELDQWATDTWDSVPTDTWAGFEDDEWETETDIQFTLNSQPLTASNIAINIATDLAFSYDDTYMAVAHNRTGAGDGTGCAFSVYKLSGGTYSKLADPADVPSGYYMNAVAWSPDAVYLAVGGTRAGSSTRMVIYKRSGDTFTKLTDPSDMPSGEVEDIAWTSEGGFLFLAVDTTNSLLYSRNGDTFTKQLQFGDATGVSIWPKAVNQR
jgi:WD40 repeat protein